MAIDQEYKERRVNNLPTSGLSAGDKYALNVGGGKYQTYIVSDTLQLVKEAGADFIEKDTMAEIRALSAREIWALQNGYYKGVKLNGYYTKGDTPAPIEYYLSETSEIDDGGSVIAVGGIKLEHVFGYIPSFLYFGAKGDGTSDDTEKIQKAIDYSVKMGISINDRSVDKTFRVTSLNIPVSTVEINSNSIIKGLSTSKTNTIINFSNGVNKAKLGLKIDMSNGDGFGIDAKNCTNCIFEKNHIFGMTDNTDASRFGIVFRAGAKGNIVRFSKIEGFENRTNPALAVILIAMFGDVPEQYAGFFNDGNIVLPSNPVEDNKIYNNELFYGEVGVDILSGLNNEVYNNTIYKSKTRAVYLANSSNNNIIRDNVIIGFGSSAVLLAYGSSYNEVFRNKCHQIPTYNPHGAEAAINIICGSSNNKVYNNDINSFTNYGVYLAVNVSGNIVVQNDIRGYYLSSIALENDWIRPLPENSTWSRPNYGAPLLGDKWGSKDSNDNVITGNNIYESYAGRQVCSIYVAQLGTLTGMSNNTVSANNLLHEQQANNWSLWFFENTSGKLINNNLFDNKIKNVNILRQFFTRGKLHFKQCYNNDGLDTAQVSFPVGDTTPSVAKGYVFFCSNVSPTIITNFDDGISNQEIVVRLDANTTIAYSGAYIFTQNSVNIVGTGVNYVRFRKVGTVWVELGRNFQINATPTLKGLVNQATALANISQADLVATTSPVATVDTASTATDAAGLLTDLNDLISKYNVAVALINELKTKYDLNVNLTNAIKTSQNTELANQRTAGQQAT